jgi:hypothetical protein
MLPENVRRVLRFQRCRDATHPDHRRRDRGGVRRHKRQRISPLPCMCKPGACLQGLNVRRLPALRSLHNVELHGLAFLQTLESV